MTETKPRVGLVGTGYMGHGLGGCLTAAGYPLGVHDLVASRAEDMVTAGAQWYDSPAELAAASDVLLLSLFDAASVETVLFGPRGAAETDIANKRIIDTTTIPPSRGVEFAARLRAARAEALDAPVIGGTNAGKSGLLVVGGEEQVYARHRTMLEAMARRVVHVGPCGAGYVVKMMNQLIVNAHAAASAEAWAYGERMGIDVARAARTLSPDGGAPIAWLAAAVERLAGPDARGDGGHWTRLFLKDMDCVLDGGLDMTVARAVRAVNARAMEREPEKGWPYSLLAAERAALGGEGSATGGEGR